MKKVKTLLIVSSILFCIFAAILCVITVLMPTDDINWGVILALLNPAKVLFAFGIILLILFVVSCFFSNDKNDAKKLCKLISCFLCIGLILAGIFSIKGYKSPKEFWYSDEDKEHFSEIEKYLPYNSMIQSSSASSDVAFEVDKVSADCGIKYISAFNATMYSASYEAEYFSSRDRLLNHKFIYDRTVPSISNDWFIDVEAEPVHGETDGIDYYLYSQDDSYSLAILNKSDAYYVSLLDAGSLDINTENFVKTAVEQYRLMQNAAKLDVYEF